MKTFIGIRCLETDTCTVTVDGRPLDPRLDLASLSPEGFEWGYWGDAAGQLAIAILADVAGDEAALANYQLFKCRVVGGLAGEWRLTEAMIRDWLDDHGRTPDPSDQLAGSAA